MKRSLAILALALLTTSALAADNAVIVTPGSGVTMRTTDVGSLVQSPNVILSSITGAAIYGTAGTANANIISVQGIASMTPLLVTATVTGTAAVTQSGTWTVRNTGNAGAIYDGVIGAATAPANMTVGGGVFNSSPITLTTGQSAALQFDANGFLKVNTAAGAAAGGTSSNFGSAFPTPGTAAGFTDGTNMVAGRVTTYGTAPTGFNALAVNAFVTNANANGQTTMSASSPVTIASDQSAVSVKATVAATGGATTTGNIAANNTTAVVVKASAGTLYGVQLAGIGSAPAYLKIYNATSATCGSGTPVKRLIIPAASTAANGAGSNVTFGPQGVAFGTGITYCVTTGITDADTTAPAASTYLINIDWN